MYCSKCGTQILDTSTFCSSCGSQVVKSINLDESVNESTNINSGNNLGSDLYKNFLIPVIIFGLIIFLFKKGPDIMDSIKFPNSPNSSYSSSLKFEGLWRCPFPKTSIEFQSSGRVIISPSYGNSKTPNCVTDGTWEKINDNEIQVSIINNPNCEINSFVGIWRIEEGKNYDGSKMNFLSFGNLKFIKE